ncbi:MAG TPA: redoxin domain-containing protein [Gemmatimonadales bacterium]|nr:redoxin domain-containing protein [Gemmatimonadales bacterium]
MNAIRPRLAVAGLLAFLPTVLVAQNPAAFVVSGPEAGTRAPFFVLDAAGKAGRSDRPFDLSLQLGRVVVLAFYQRDFTPTATKELTAFADRFQELFGDSTTVVGVGVDSLDLHQSFAQSLALPFALLADTGLHVARLYGSVRPDGYARYSVYVIGPDGRVSWRDLRFDPAKDGSYDELRRAVAAAHAPPTRK